MYSTTVHASISITDLSTRAASYCAWDRLPPAGHANCLKTFVFVAVVFV